MDFETLTNIIIIGAIVSLIIYVALIVAIFRIANNSDRIRDQLEEMKVQNEQLKKLIDIQSELLGVEIREQRKMHGYDVNIRLDQ